MSIDVRRTLTLLAFVGAAPFPPRCVFAQPAPDAVAKTPAAAASAIEEVWRREADYWRFVKSGDDESYVKLWHERFIGWPCGAEHPKRKAGIGAWVREVKDKRLKVEVDMTREAAEQFGDTVVVHYRFTRVDTYPDGHVEGKGVVSKITHTWMKTGGEWLIVGGMCGPVEDKAK
jgi:hypothetical protein